jgi:hypothetical protein
MIATVRIAPVERWCEEVKRTLSIFPALANIVGMPVGILTETMSETNCYQGEPAREWELAPESNRALDEATGTFEDDAEHLQCGFRICEHMLEMD